MPVSVVSGVIESYRPLSKQNLLTTLVLLQILVCNCTSQTISTNIRAQMDGDFIIAGVIPVHTQMARQFWKPVCTGLDLKNIMVVESLIYTTRKINEENILLGYKLGFDIRDTCFYVMSAMRHGLNFLYDQEEWMASFYDSSLFVNKSGKCVPKPIVGYIGPSSSSEATAIAGMHALYKIPVISYFATSTALSNKNVYPTFFRTVPADDQQTIAMTELLAYHNWNYIAAIASDDEYGRAGMDALIEQTSAKNICLALDELYDIRTGGDDRVRQLIAQIRENERVKVVVLFMTWQIARLFLEEASRQNLTGITYIASESWADHPELKDMDTRVIQGVLGVSLPQFYDPEFRKYLRQRRVAESARDNPWLLEYMVNVHNCNPLKDVNSRLCDKLGETLPACQAHQYLSDIGVSEAAESVTLNAIDAMWSYAYALQELVRTSVGKTVYHSKLVELLKKTNFQGKGDQNVMYDEYGDRKVSIYNFVNVQVRNDSRGNISIVIKKVGDWLKLDTFTTNRFNSNLVQYNHNGAAVDASETTRPTSSCSDVCPAGWRMEPSPSECCWDCVECEPGYYSSLPGQRRCTLCGLHMHTDLNQTQCLPNFEIWVVDSFPLNVIIAALSLIGILFMTVVSVIVLRYRKLVVIQKIQFKTIFIVVNLAGLASPLLHLTKPGTFVCVFQQLVLLSSFTLQAVILFAQADLETCGIKIKYYSPNTALAVFGTFGFLLNLLSLAPEVPQTSRTLHESDTSFLTCPDVFTAAGMISAIYVIILTILAGFLFERMKDLENYNNFSCYIFLVITCVYIPIFVTLEFIEGKIAVGAICFFIEFSMLTGLKFMPTFYEIFIEGRTARVEVSPNCQSDVLPADELDTQDGTTCVELSGMNTGSPLGPIQEKPEETSPNRISTDDLHERPQRRTRLLRIDSELRAPRALDEIAILDMESDQNNGSAGATQNEVISHL